MLTDQISRHQTIGHQILDLEAELGIDTEPHKETLDKLIEEARNRIAVKASYTREEAVGILRTIDEVIQSNVLNPRTIDEPHLFYEGLDNKEINCSDTSLIYLSIADALGLPLVAVSAPEHLFVRFMLSDGSYINWETTGPGVLSDDYYQQRFNISDAAIKNGVFLKNLTREGIIAIAYYNRGNARADEGKGNLDRAIEDYNEAIRLNPSNAVAYHNRGNCWSSKGSLDKAIADYDGAIRLDPNFAKAYNSRGSAWADKGNLDKAIDDYNESIRLNPNGAAAYHNRGIARFKKHQYAGALLDFARSKLPILR